MATFIWPAEVQWPPPGHVLLNYDTTPPSAPAVETQAGVLSSSDFVSDTHGGTRVVLVPQPIDPDVADLQDRVTSLEQQMALIEAQVHVPPVVLEQGITVAATLIVLNAVIANMQASSQPTSWAITYQDLNGLPTTGYWAIDSSGVVTVTQFAASAGIKRGSVITIRAQATNAYGTSSDGNLVINTS
jgi:hypothetical protein